MTGEGLEPSTNGLTYLIGFHRPPCPRVRPQGRIREQGVDGLDYLFAVAGVPRLVSGAGAGDPPVPCLLIAQSPGFSNHHDRRYRPRCGARALRGSQHIAAFTRRGSVSSRARLLRSTPSGVLKSVALPTELPGLERSVHLLRLSSRNPIVQSASIGPGRRLRLN